VVGGNNSQRSSNVDKITVLVIDNQAFFRAGVCQALSKHPDFNIIDCDPSQDPLKLIEANLPDFVLLGSDLATPGWLELGTKIARYYPNTKVIMLSPDSNDEEIFEIIKTAAVACLNKNTTAEELVNTIRRACKGEYPMNESLVSQPVIARNILKHFQNVPSAGKTTEHKTTPLTHREMQILNYIASGNSNKQIGSILGISEQTIKNHVSTMLHKLNVNCRARLVTLAIRNGWLSVESKLGDMVTAA